MKNTSVQETSLVKEQGGEDYPEMVGFIKENTISAETQNQADEPEEIITKGSFLQRGGMKAIVVSCGVFLGVGLFGATIYGLKGSITNPSSQVATTTTKTERHDPEESTGQQKTEVALTSQKAELSNVGHDPTNTSPTPTATPTATPTPTLNPKPTPKVRTLSREVSPQPQRQIQIVHAPAPPERIHSSAPLSPPSLTPPQIMAVQQRSLPSTISTPTPVPSIDPNVAWQAAANIGMYGDAPDSNEVKPDPKPKDVKPTPEVIPNAAPTADYNSGRSVIVGSNASGKLETAIAWTSQSNVRSEQSYLIRLTEPLKSADGTVIIPKDAMIVAHVKSATEAGLLDMSAVSMVIQEKNGVVEKSIPEGAILIQGGGGSPLKAQYRVPSHFGADVRTAALAGMGKAAEIYNSSNNTISINNGGSSATSSNGRRNIWAGAIQGSTQELVNRAQQTNNQRNQLEGSNYSNRILTLDKGADVQIFVNRSVNL